ncbi:hypothetical protein GH808_03745 [Acetobacterium fimetarium]|uniref:MYG1 protein n=1 Tax=Acetobacterium fimetarium TaxID=52691 RepID=A0ABR6WTD9_9FIRM|nr:MYG1 family protein [Acetobacterium fimetarium]MBC3803549.1 hypothetical protein [Acetobacterium fimetarium]
MSRVLNEAMTHNGRFHTDDVFSAALLKILNPQIKIERKNAVPEGYSGLVFDLGEGIFDHHGERSSFRDNGVQYASFGLLWKEYGHTLVSEKEALIFDESFVQPLDIQDNNGGNNLLCRAITQMNPKWDEEIDFDQCFFKAVDMAAIILTNEIKSMRSTEHAEATVLSCLENQKNGIVVIPKGMPWKSILIPSDALYVVFPSPRGGYNAQAVPKDVSTQECKLSFPQEWRGKREELSEVTGINGITFCHLHGYLLGAETEEAAIEACKLSIQKGGD